MTGAALPAVDESNRLRAIVLYAMGIAAIIAAGFLVLRYLLPGPLFATSQGGPPSLPSGFFPTSTPSLQSTQVLPENVGLGGATAESEATPFRTATPSPEPFIVPIDLKTNEKDDAQIVLVPAGSFVMGSNQREDPYFWGAETPKHTVTLSGFWIYRTEVTQGMYAKCVQDKGCRRPKAGDQPVARQYGNPRFADYPVVMVRWPDAKAYCKWAGARLPTEAEWEKAARGGDGRLFPWGNDGDPDGRANFLTSSTSSVGSYPAGASPYGAYDMAGNVLEWVADFFDSSYYQYSALDDPRGPETGTRRVIRGGAFNQEELAGIRTVARASLKPGETFVSVGFRCAMDKP